MDVYGGVSAPEYFRIDDLLDFSNEEIFSSSAASSAGPHPPPPPQLPFSSSGFDSAALSTDFTDHLSVPSDDVAELEWLSRFVDDSFTDFPTNSLAANINVRSVAPFSGRARSKRSKGGGASSAFLMPASPEFESPASSKPKSKKESSRSSSPTPEGGVRRCTHCASEKTPQWRSGPMGPKTLCNACGVRYKSGRLVPEYRPAASPTFVLTQHSNSHRKVMELRRQKEEMLRQQQQEQQQSDRIYHHHHHDFRVC